MIPSNQREKTELKDRTEAGGVDDRDLVNTQATQETKMQVGKASRYVTQELFPNGEKKSRTPRRKESILKHEEYASADQGGGRETFKAEMTLSAGERGRERKSQARG